MNTMQQSNGEATCEDSIIQHLINEVINRTISHSTSHSFRSEEEIQGYFVASVQNELSSNEVCIQEYPTEQKYRRDDNLLRPTGEGRSGFIDVVIESDGKKGGIELEYPRGTGRDKQNFEDHVQNDIMKLTMETGLSGRYLIIFAYNDPPLDVNKFLDGLSGVVNIAFFRLAKGSEGGRQEALMWSVIKPDGWFHRDCR